jgi:hypothetical protein
LNIRKGHIAPFTVFATLLFCKSVSAQILFTEDFLYNPGPLSGVWGSQCSGPTATVVSPGLIYPGYAASNQGNALRLFGEGSEYKSNYKANKQTWPYYLSMLVNVKSTGPGNGATCGTGMDYLFNFKLYAGGTDLNIHTGLITTGFGPGQFLFGMKDVTSVVVTNTAYNLNTTYLLVVELTQTHYKVFINPPLGAPMPAPDIVLPITSNDGVENILLGQNNYGDILIDGLLLSNQWSDVVQTILAPEPLASPSDLQFYNISSTGLTAQYTQAPDSPTGTLAVRRAGSAPQFVPVNGTSYTPGQSVGNGETIVLASGCCSFVETTLLPQEQSFYKIFSFNQTAGINTIRYRTSDFLSGSQFTWSQEPAAHPAFLTPQAISANEIKLTFPAASTIADADGYLILKREDGDTPTNQNIVNGIAPASLQLPSGTALLANLPFSNISTLTDTGLAGGSLYHYAILPYNWNGLNTETYNYLITEPILTTATFTLPEAPIPLLPSVPTQQGFTGNWNSVTGATSYSMDVSTDNFASLLISASGIPGTSHSLAGLNKGTQYQYIIKAHNTSGTSASSAPMSALTLPAAPTNPSVSQVLTNSYVVNWTLAPGVVDHYELEVSKDDFVTFVVGYGPKIIGATSNLEGVSNLLPSTFYKFRVRAVNSSGSSEYLIGGAYTLAAAVPVLNNPVFNQGFNGNAITVSTQVTNASAGLQLALKHKKVASGSAFTEETLALVSETSEIVLDESNLDELGMEFYIVAEDGAWKDSTTLRKIYPVFTDATSPLFIHSPFGGEIEDYQMVSIPYDLQDNLIESIFGKTLGGYDTKKWRLGHYENGVMLEAENGLNKIVRGKAYWFNARITDTLSIRTGSGEAPKNDSGHPYLLTLQPGWNQIGNPYPFMLKWTSVLQSNPAVGGVGGLKIFSGGAYDNGDTMPVYSGGFVFADQATTLTIPVTLRIPEGGRLADSHDEKPLNLIEEAWQLNLQLRQGKRVNRLGGLGMHPNAKPGKDDFDDLNLPRFNDYLEVVFDHPEFFYSSFSRDIVPTAEQHTWKFTIESNRSGETELRWPGDTGDEDGPRLFLLDLSGSVLIDMRAQSSYVFTMTEKSRDFQVFFSTDMNSGLLFDAFELGKAFPNPSSGTTTIPFVVPSGKDSYSVEISICDAMGKLTHTLIFDSVAPGLHHAIWDGTDITGSMAGHGVYVYRLRLDGKPHQTARKMIRR